jgi:hypothetical protein
MDDGEDVEAMAWHRRFGGALFNDCWDLIENDGRTPDDDVEMLLAAMASRWHWAQVGGPEQIATGDWQVAHVASLLGLADLALLFAERNLSIATGEGWLGWRLASAHEGMARACAVAGDAERRDEHVTRARQALEVEADDELREVIAGQVDAVPPADGR